MFGGCLLAAGRLADRIGRRRTFTLGLALFAVASLACGLAPNAAFLLAARAIQGIGAALVSPAALALVTSASQGPRALGWWTAAAAGGGASGWVLGGVLSGLLDWRWVFLVNVPVCAAAAVLAPRVLDEWRDEDAPRLDLAGAALATTGLAALVLAFTLIERHGPLATAPLLAFATAAALLTAFAFTENRVESPLLDGRVRKVLGPNAVAAVLTATTGPPIFMCTLHAQQILGLPPATAGLLFAPVNLAVIAGSLLGPRVVAATGEQAAMAGGLLAVAGGALALTAIAPDAPALPTMLGGFVVLGLGLGVASVASTARGTAAARRRRPGPGVPRCWPRARSSAPRSASRSCCRSPPPTRARSGMARRRTWRGSSSASSSPPPSPPSPPSRSWSAHGSRWPASLIFMEHRQLGRSGLRVSVLGLGTMGFGGAGKFANVGELDVQAAGRQIDLCLDAGVTLVDTANVYSQGASEEIVGKAIRGRRDRITLATKARFAMGDGPNDAGLSRTTSSRRARTACAASAPTGSTSTRCTSGTARRRSRRR